MENVILKSKCDKSDILDERQRYFETGSNAA